jgi:hypothetical protein
MEVPVLEVAWVPDQESEPVPPLAVQLLALPTFQVRLIDCPGVIVSGLAANVTDGGAGGAEELTVTI